MPMVISSLFADANNQTLASAIKTTFYGSNVHCLTTFNGLVYMNWQGMGTLVQLNSDGTFNQTIVGGFSNANGVIGDSQTGHLFMAAGNGLFDVDPIAKTKSLFVANGALDGLTISPDNSVLYAAGNGQITGYSTTSGAVVFTSGAIAGGPDGADWRWAARGQYLCQHQRRPSHRD